MGLFKESPYKEATQQIISKINCNYKVFSEDCTEEQVNKVYMEELERGKEEGFVPVLVPCDETFAEWLDINDEEKEDIINSAGNNGEELLKEWYDSFINDYYEDFGKDSLNEHEGKFINNYDINTFSGFESYSGNGIEETILFEIPVDKPWKVIAWLPMGGWNDCPAPEEMITVCRYWYEKYGAVPAVITHDVMEFFVEKPVTSEEKAWQLAREHYAYTPDRVDQCTKTGTLGEVAGCLLNSKVWYFWWD